ncbi:hypothetical protein C5F59_027545 [Streptomyces sp. QL37]|uniref:hypothetical protein n=1 Tax=Streptomyces sp. QL37 TaxID=2093747 RepID=UPI000CF283CD|nr:hypothetical protein [Streptomyces sp. QL37]PPQ57130.1 hypothetical protein C5F59_10885 [Streptomyces sp. QL37]
MTTRLQNLARRLVDGARLLTRRQARRLAAWIRRGRREDLTGLAAVLGCIVRALLVAAGAYGLWRIIRATPELLFALVPVWCWAAIRTAQDAAEHVPEEVPEDVQEDAGTKADRGTALLWHVVHALAAAESASRAGLHLDTVLDSAVQVGLIPADTELPAMRAWVEAAGLPVADQVGYRIGGKPVTRVGFKLSAVTEALGMTPTALVQARSETPVGGASAAPTQPVEEIPVGVPASTSTEAPVSAVLRLIPGGRQNRLAAAPLLLSKERAQGVR